jgi:hypothetical protein
VTDTADASRASSFDIPRESATRSLNRRLRRSRGTATAIVTTWLLAAAFAIIDFTHFHGKPGGLWLVAPIAFAWLGIGLLLAEGVILNRYGPARRALRAVTSGGAVVQDVLIVISVVRPSLFGSLKPRTVTTMMLMTSQPAGALPGSKQIHPGPWAALTGDCAGVTEGAQVPAASVDDRLTSQNQPRFVRVYLFGVPRAGEVVTVVNPLTFAVCWGKLRTHRPGLAALRWPGLTPPRSPTGT